MTRFALLLSLTSSMLAVVPAVAADKFECPSPFKPNTPALVAVTPEFENRVSGLFISFRSRTFMDHLSFPSFLGRRLRRDQPCKHQ